jgi:hypothetical protein
MKPSMLTISTLPSRQCHASSGCMACRRRMLTFFCERERFTRVTLVTSFATDPVPGKLGIVERHWSRIISNK